MRPAAVGPILHFRGQREGRWRLAALLVARAGGEPPGPLTLPSAAPVAPERLAARQGHGFWRYDFSLPLGDREACVPYALAGREWPVRLPAARGGRRLAYAACGGTEGEEEEEEGGGGGPAPASARNALWRKLAAEHARRPFHLLLHGGDQLYADTIWGEVPELGAWRRLPWRAGNAAPFTPAMAEGAGAYYLRRYLRLWSQPEVAPLLATVPSLMMWDDHDVFDGWGSWPDDRQRCPVFQGLMGVAREHFALFQLAARAGRLPAGFADPRGGHFGWAFWAGGGVGVVAPDLRSERSRARVMGAAGWRGLGAGLAGLAGRRCRHLLVLSSVPLVNADLSAAERVLVALPGHSDLEDDLRDQWQSLAHRGEWRRVLRRLAAFAAQTGARVTSLAGEIHLGALGLVEGAGGAAVLHELTSSGIVHAPPPALLTALYELVARRPVRPAADLEARLLPIPGHGRRYLRARNWLALELGGDGRLEAVWHTERGAAGRLALGAKEACPGGAG